MRRLGFTLVELLVVVALIAIVGAGVAISYSREIVDRANDQMTVHEQGQIREAFSRFYADNGRRLLDIHKDPQDVRNTLPSDDFKSTFHESEARKFIDSNAAQYGMFELFERFGLWFLLQPAPSGGKSRTHYWRDDFTQFPEFDPVTGEGWQGPYIRTDRVVPVRERRTDGLYTQIPYTPEVTSGGAVRDPTDLVLPQPSTRLNPADFYRVVYYEHCKDPDREEEPVYRRVLLLCADRASSLDSAAKCLRYSGNRRNRRRDRSDNTGDHNFEQVLRSNPAFPLDLRTGAVIPRDPQRGVMITELLNLDTWER